MIRLSDAVNPDLVMAADVEVGHHHKISIGGIEFHIDTIATTCIAGAIVILMGLWLARTATSGVPSKIQLFWEAVVGWVQGEVNNSLGKTSPFVVPLAVTLFFFILFCNWLELLPLKVNEHDHLLVVPTADTNLTYALAAVTIISVWAYGIRQKGLKGYLKHFFEPFPVMFPLNLLEELIKPVTLALRLFGNIFAGGIMLALIGLMPFYIAWAPNLLWKAFGGAIAVIQAFIFALLTVLYFAMAGAGHGDEHHDEHDEAADDAHADSPEVDKVPVPA